MLVCIQFDVVFVIVVVFFVRAVLYSPMSFILQYKVNPCFPLSILPVQMLPFQLKFCLSAHFSLSLSLNCNSLISKECILTSQLVLEFNSFVDKLVLLEATLENCFSLLLLPYVSFCAKICINLLRN